MLSEFNKLKSPPPETEQIELISKHSLEKYRVALYGANIASVMELLLRAHELHSVLGPSGPPTSSRYNEQRKPEPYCFKCSQPGFTFRTCPNCNNLPTFQSTTAEPGLVQPTPVCAPPDAGQQKTDKNSATAPSQGKQAVNYRGGRTFRRGHPPPSR